MRDTERLELLKEIGGTKVYDERRKESLKIMQETGNSMTHVFTTSYTLIVSKGTRTTNISFRTVPCMCGVTTEALIYFPSHRT
eukprot:2459727-Pyramimonas_sp.AAC.1